MSNRKVVWLVLLSFIKIFFFFFFFFFFNANSVDPDQMPHFVASDLGLHCLSFCGAPGINGLNSAQCEKFLQIL